jgi:hypothetical protein
MANATAATTHVSEANLARMKMDEVRNDARGIGLKNVDDFNARAARAGEGQGVRRCARWPATAAVRAGLPGV